MRGDMDGFLIGYRILDLTDQKGHLCGRILGDMGADVIKIEPPGGDLSRSIGAFYHDEPDPEKNLNWFFTNANKRGITLDPGTADGKKIFLKLVEGADLVLESFEPGYMNRIGLGYEDLAKVKSNIILTSIAPYGQSGPKAHHKITDLIAGATGGQIILFGDRDRPPVRITAPQSYFMGSQHAAVGSISALYHREISGEGQSIDVSIQEAVMYSLTYNPQYWDQNQFLSSRSGQGFIRLRLPLPDVLENLGLGNLEDWDPQELYQKLKELDAVEEFMAKWIFPCRDGHVCLALQGSGGAPIKSSREIVAWANAEGYALNIKDYDWGTWDSSTISQDQQHLLESEIGAFLLTKTKAELLEQAAKRRILLAPVNTVADLPENPQFSHRDFWQKVFHQELGETLTYPGPSVKVNPCPQKIFRKAPGIGEHNREIYVEEMQMSEEELATLKGKGVI